jgi:hypothetical protein
LFSTEKIVTIPNPTVTNNNNDHNTSLVAATASLAMMMFPPPAKKELAVVSTSATTTSTTTPSQPPTSPSFLLYYTHGGYSNQLIALQHAAQLAYKLNRTLVIPPVLPHTNEEIKLFPDWKRDAAGTWCQANQKYAIHQIKAVNQA